MSSASSRDSSAVPERLLHVEVLVAGALAAIALQWTDARGAPTSLELNAPPTRVCEAHGPHATRLHACADEALWYAPNAARRAGGALPCRWQLDDADLASLGVNAEARAHVAWLLATDSDPSVAQLDAIAGVGPTVAQRLLVSTETRCARGLLPPRVPTP